MSGSGELTVQSARFRRGRLEEGSGILVAGPGTIDRSLLMAAVDRLGLLPGDGLSPHLAERRVRPEQTAHGVSAYIACRQPHPIRATGPLRHARRPGPGAPRPVRRHRAGHDPQRRPPPPAGRASAAASAGRRAGANARAPERLQVPASRQTDWLLRHLPVPEVIPPAGAHPRPPWIELHYNWHGSREVP